MIQFHSKDLGAGLVFALIGLIYGGTTLKQLPIGTATEMGPGYFPLALSAILLLIGAALIFDALRKGRSDGAVGTIAWRAIFVLGLVPVVFALLLAPIGLWPTSFLVGVLTSLAQPGAKPLRVAILSAVLATMSTVIFVTLLGLPVAVFGPLFG